MYVIGNIVLNSILHNERATMLVVLTLCVTLNIRRAKYSNVSTIKLISVSLLFVRREREGKTE